MSALPFERLAVYGFAMDYPTNCRVEFNPKSDRNQGDIAFKSSDGYKVFLSWGEMKKVEKFRDIDAHADYSLERIKGSREAKILDVKRERRRANGHPASFNHVKLELVKRGIFFNQTKTSQEVRSLHLHCENTSRYFVIYGPATPLQSEKQGEIIARMIQSFVCHQ